MATLHPFEGQTTYTGAVNAFDSSICLPDAPAMMIVFLLCQWTTAFVLRLADPNPVMLTPLSPLHVRVQGVAGEPPSKVASVQIVSELDCCSEALYLVLVLVGDYRYVGCPMAILVEVQLVVSAAVVGVRRPGYGTLDVQTSLYQLVDLLRCGRDCLLERALQAGVDVSHSCSLLREVLYV